MVLCFYPHQSFRLGERVEPRLHPGGGAELVVSALDEDPGHRAWFWRAAVGGEAGRDQAGRDSGFAPEPQDDSRAEREARESAR
jgi:hypothetical protein